MTGPRNPRNGFPIGTFPRALTITKRCSRCRDFKWPYQFRHRSGARSHQLRSLCRECERLEMASKRRADPEKYRQMSREWDRDNPEKAIEKGRRYRERHPERVKAYAKHAHQDNARRWLAKNGPGVERARVRARLRAGLHQAARKDPEIVLWTQIIDRDPCSYCDAPSEHWDHIVPLSAGGDSSWENLTSSCASCNPSKNASPLLIFLLRRVGATTVR